MKTKESKLSSAEICRKMGWRRGTKLIGNEGYGNTVIKITAVGNESILAIMISHNDIKAGEFEGEACWTLKNRNWRKFIK